MRVYPRQSHLCRLAVGALLAAGLSLGAVAGAEEARPADSPEAGQPQPLLLEDLPEPLSPKQPRTEAEEDRLEAMSLYTAARAHERGGDYALALRLYQRALRYDPEAISVVRAIIPLAIRLERDGEALRYMRKALELEDPDPSRLVWLGAYLLAGDDLTGVLDLYERALAARAGAEPTADDVRLQLVAGRLYQAQDEHGKAADCFARVIEALDHPEQYGLDDRTRSQMLGDPGTTYGLFGESFLLAGRLDEASAAFQRQQQLAPDKGTAEFNRARILARRGQPEQALAALEAAFEQNLEGAGTVPFDLLAEVLNDLGKKEELIERLEKLRAKYPENVPLGYVLAEQYHEAGLLDKAEPLYQELLKEAPTTTGYGHLAEIYAKSGRPDELLGILAEVIEQTGMLETLGPQAEEISGNAELMASLADAARTTYRREPKELGYYTRLAIAMLALQAEEYGTAAEFFDLAIEADPQRGNDLLLVWGLELLYAERPAEAAEVFQRAIDDPALADDAARFQYFLSRALAVQEKPEEALAAARKAQELGGDAPLFASQVGWLLFHARRYDEATKTLRELVEKYDSDYTSDETRDVLREARLLLSNLYVIKEDMAQAEEWLQQVLDEFPDDPGASNDLGYLWADLGIHLERALRMIRLAVDAEPDNAAYVDSLGWAFHRLGRHDEALAELKKAAAADSEPDPVILDHLGDAYQKLNQPDEAKQAWRQAVEAFKKHDEPEKAQQVQQKIDANE